MELKKEKKKNLQIIVKKVLTIYRESGVTPKQVRYINKEVRVQGKYQIPNNNRKLPEYLNSVEMDVAMNKALSKDSNTILLFNIGFYTGLRIGEMHNLMIENIDFDNRQLKVVQGKGSKDRFVILTTQLMQLLKSIIGDRDKGFLFVKSNGVQYSKRALQDKITAVFVTCSFAKQNLSAHTLRHSFATLCLRAGLSIDKLQLLMGHTNRKTTEIYSHLELGDVKAEFIKKIGYGVYED